MSKKSAIYSSDSPESSPAPSQTAGASNFQITITLDLDINGAAGECVTPHEQTPTSGTGLSYSRSPSRAKTIPAVSLDSRPSEESRQPQRRSSLSLEGRSDNAEYEEPQQQAEPLETLQLRVQEGDRSRELLEAETVRIDGLQREVEAKIREMERRAEEDARDPLSGTRSNTRSTMSATQLTPTPNNPRNPEVEEERIHPVPNPSPSRQQGESAGQQQRSWSRTPHGRCTRHCACEPGSAYALGSTYNTPSPVPLVCNSQQESWIQSCSSGEDSYTSSRPILPYPSSESTEPLNTHLHHDQPSQYAPPNGPARYGYMEPIEQSQNPFLGTIIGANNYGQLSYPQGNAAFNLQQELPQFLSATPYPYTERNLSHLYRPQSPQFSHLGVLGYTGYSAYSLPSNPIYGGEGHDSGGPPWPRAQQHSAADPEDDYFGGGFDPRLMGGNIRGYGV